MTSRERILATLNHNPVDRIPIDFNGTRQSGISVFAYARLRSYLGLPSEVPIRVYDLFQMLAEIEPEVIQRFGVDCVGLNRKAVAFAIPNEDWKTFTAPGWPQVEVPGSFSPETDPQGGLILHRQGQVIARMPAGGFYFDRFEKNPGALHPDLDEWTPPTFSTTEIEHFRSESQRLYQSTDKAVVAAVGPPFELFNGMGQGGFEDWMATFATEREYVQRLYAKVVKAWIENLETFHGAVGDRVQILQINDDFGTQNAPFLSTRAFRELIMPAYKRGLDWIHQRTSWKVLLHSDGALVPLLPSIIEMGVDILNPVQTTAAGMDPHFLKHEFGSRLCFWGGSCDCQGTLTRGTPSQVSEEVRRHLDALSPGGGHIFASVHNIQANVPPENVAALFDTALHYAPKTQ